MKNINRKIVVLIFAMTLLIYQGISYAAAPTFDDGEQKTVSVAENTAIGTEIVRLPVTDPDNDIVGTIMFGNPWKNPGDFTLDSSRTETDQYVVVLKNTVTLDYETQTSYHYQISVSDEDQNTDSISVTINITNDPSDDTPNNPPTFTDGESATRSIQENRVGGSNVGSPISATDSDNDTLTYRLDVDSTDVNSFSINSSTGQLSSSTRFDFETKNSYEVTVTVSDGRGGTDSITVTISITNDTSDDPTPNNPPTFTDGERATRSIQENMAGGSNVGSAIAATDTDNDTLTYRLSSGDVNSFSINSSTGQLSSSTRFDFETKNSYEVTITVSDGEGGTDSITVTISITNDTSDDPTPNNPPTFTDGERATRSIQENMAGGSNVGSAIAATDTDNDTLTYRLDVDSTDVNSFSINSSTGQLSSSTRFDFETKNSYEVTITVSDGEGGTDSITVTISITNDTSDDPTPNNPPTFDDGDQKTVSVAENTAIGTEIVRLPVTDPDNDIVGVVMAGNPWARPGDFKIESSRTETNQYVAVLKNTVTLDYETQTSYHYTVTVTDEDQNTDSISVTINITNDTSDDTPNNPPTFTDGERATRSIQENMPGGTDVGSAISATDSDSSDTLTYSLDVTGDVNSFSINSSTGQLQSSTQFDYENKKSYEVTVSVSDGKGGTDSISVTISVINDTSDDLTTQQQVIVVPPTDPVSEQQVSEPGQEDVTNSIPAFDDGPSTTRSIQENTTSGTNIGLPVSATDDDSGDTLEYTLSGTDAASFSINSATGHLQTSAALDYEKKKSYEVTVSVSDGSGGSDTITVTITVDDVDENPPTDPVPVQQVPETEQDDVTNSAPTFDDGDSTKRLIAENTASGTNIGLPVSATDGDSGDTLEYTLDGTDAGAFSIVSTTGQLQTSVALDYEKKKSYEVTVSVSDGNGGSDSITVTITVDDVDENPPTDPVPVQQVPETEQDDDVQQPKSEADPEPEPNYTIIPFDYEREGVGKVVFSELMLARLGKYPQWIELYNTTDQDVDINGWKIVGRYLDDSNTINILESQVISKSFTIKGKEIGLIVSFAISNSRDRISKGLADKAYALQSTSKNFWNYEGFVLELQDAEGNPIDRIGNLNEENEIVWEIPLVVRDKRISLMRRLKSMRSQEYNLTFGIKEFGWFSAEKVEHLIEERNQYYYGRYTDIGTPGYRTEDGEILPVKLSSFRSQLNKNGQIILSWVTESELDNAGFNILRSQSKQGPFVKVNPKLIQGAGTTGKRSSYTWIDTTAKSDVVYYYRIEDVSFAGFRNQLATVRTRGHVSASERYITQWGNLKKQN